jgi:hypothetical protein
LLVIWCRRARCQRGLLLGHSRQLLPGEHAAQAAHAQQAGHRSMQHLPVGCRPCRRALLGIQRGVHAALQLSKSRRHRCHAGSHKPVCSLEQALLPDAAAAAACLPFPFLLLQEHQAGCRPVFLMLLQIAQAGCPAFPLLLLLLLQVEQAGCRLHLRQRLAQEATQQPENQNPLLHQVCRQAGGNSTKDDGIFSRLNRLAWQGAALKGKPQAGELTGGPR